MVDAIHEPEHSIQVVSVVWLDAVVENLVFRPDGKSLGFIIDAKPMMVGSLGPSKTCGAPAFVLITVGQTIVRRESVVESSTWPADRSTR